MGEFDLDTAAGNVAGALPHAVVAGVRGEVREQVELVEFHQPDVVFNVCEAPLGRTDSSSTWVNYEVDRRLELR